MKLDLQTQSRQEDYRRILNHGALPYTSTTDRDAIIEPVVGQSVYNSTTNKVNVWDGSVWVELADNADVEQNATDIQGAYSYFPIWAEESAALTQWTFQWSFGNGDETPQGSGIPVFTDCELIAISAEVEGGTGITIRVWKNAALGASTDTFNGSVNTILSTPLSFVAGDIVNFKTGTVTSGGTSGRVCAWFRVPII